jgi:structural maintenance of chromosome 2
VTFNDRIRTKSVTLDGDVYDPAGTLTGGSSSSSSSVLAQLQQLKDAKKQLVSFKAILHIHTFEKPHFSGVSGGSSYHCYGAAYA